MIIKELEGIEIHVLYTLKLYFIKLTFCGYNKKIIRQKSIIHVHIHSAPVFISELLEIYTYFFPKLKNNTYIFRKVIYHLKNIPGVKEHKYKKRREKGLYLDFSNEKKEKFQIESIKETDY